jgi:polysaccharide biosynthesis transport protein
MKQGTPTVRSLAQSQLQKRGDHQTGLPRRQPEPEPELDPINEAYLPGMQRRVGVVAGVAIVITSGVAAKVVNQAPQFEGKFELAVAPVVPVTPKSETIPQPQIEHVNQLIFATPAPETQIKILKSHKFIDPTLQELGPQLSDLDYETLTKNLRIKVNPDQTLEIKYRDTDPQRVKLVLEQLAETYVRYSQECREGACKGIAYIQTQLPQVKQRINTLRAQIQQMRQQHHITNQEAQIRQFSARSTEVAKQRAEVEGKLAAARADYAELQQRMAMRPKESIALSLLSQDSPYLSTLRQLRAIDTEIAQALSQLKVDNQKLQRLALQYQRVQNQLYQDAQLSLQRHLSNPKANLQDPIFQEPVYLQLIQQSLGAVAYVQVLDHRYQILTQTEQQLQQQTDQIATLLRRYGEMQQQLQAETQSLQTYLDKLEVLKAQADQSDVAWQLAAAPKLKEKPVDQPVPIVQDLRRDVSSGAILGVLTGVGVAAALEQKNKWRPKQA